LTDGPGDDLHPSFSPDGLRIAFSRMGVIPTVTSAVYVMSRDSLGGEWDAPKLITPDTNSRFTTRWSPDGSRIATYSQNRIWIVSLQGEERLLFHGAAVGLRGSSFPDWSVDGRLIYFWARDSTGTRSMYAIPIEGGTPREVVRLDDPTKEVTLYYSLGADKVYLSVNETDSDIYVMDLEMK